MMPEHSNEPLPPQPAEPAHAPAPPTRAHSAPGGSLRLLEDLLTASLQEEELQNLLAAAPEETFAAAMETARPGTLTECAITAIEAALSGYFRGAAGLTPPVCRKIAERVAPLLLEDPASRARLEQWLTRLPSFRPTNVAPGSHSTNANGGLRPPESGPMA